MVTGKSGAKITRHTRAAYLARRGKSFETGARALTGKAKDDALMTAITNDE